VEKKKQGGKSNDKEKSKKSEKRSSKTGVHKTTHDGKEKKQRTEKLSRALEGEIASQTIEATPVASASEVQPKLVVAGALVKFAVPLADEKNTKKIVKIIRKAAKQNALKRGVKEVVKTLRKSPPASLSNRSFVGVVIIAGDISPEDVISHIPVLCEDHNAPYIFVPSRAELVAAAKTKRPTSVVMIMETGVKKRDAKNGESKASEDAEENADNDGEDYADTYLSLVKLVKKETVKQAFW